MQQTNLKQPLIIDKQVFQDVQKTHIDFLEKWLEKLPKICGISVSRCLTYEMIQILNNYYIESEVTDAIGRE